MNDRPAVAVAMSGGVDSSVAAALLLERGYAVSGLTMRLWREQELDSEPDGVEAARLVCAHLGIPFQVLDLRQAFQDEVVGYFTREYTRGRTPNPCLRCNRLMKFGLLLQYARSQNSEYLATGHYARIVRDGSTYRLLCGVDARKDQGYALYALQQAHLASLLFPLGEYTKDQVREMAILWGLPVAHRPESQDVCFLRDNDYRRFLSDRCPETVRPGPIYNVRGDCVGQHRGLPFYTVGQREGLGISAPRPLYVLELDTVRNALVVGQAEDLGRRALLAEEMVYVSGSALPDGSLVDAKIRYQAKRVAAHVWGAPHECARIEFDQPLRDIAPGQAVVLYRGDEVLGGGIISRSLSTTEAQ